MTLEEAQKRLEDSPLRQLTPELSEDFDCITLEEAEDSLGAPPIS